MPILFFIGITLGLVTAYFAHKESIKNAQKLGFMYPRTAEEKKKVNQYKEKQKTSNKWILIYAGIGMSTYKLISIFFPMSFIEIVTPIILGWTITFVAVITIASRLYDKKIRKE